MTADVTPKTRLLTEKAAWKALGEHYQNVRNVHLRSLFADDPHRGERMAVEGAGDPESHEVCAGEPRVARNCPWYPHIRTVCANEGRRAALRVRA